MKHQSLIKEVKLRLSISDFNSLQSQAAESDMFVSEYLRMLIQTIQLAKMQQSIIKSGKFELGGYGYEFNSEIFEKFIGAMTQLFESIDLEEFEKSFKVTPLQQKSYIRPKHKQGSKKPLKTA